MPPDPVTNRTLEARLRARERSVTVGGHTYVIRRPKRAELPEDPTNLELARRFVVGWDLNNIDLVPGGNPEPEPFDAELYVDWVDDNEQLWAPLAEAIVADWLAYEKAKDAAAKN